MPRAATQRKYLSQVVAIETDVRKGTREKLTSAYHALQKQALLEGLTGEYQPRDEEGEKLPSEELRVQATVEEMITTTREVLGDLFDITAARDFTNASGAAKADVVIGETTLIADAPVPYLLWLSRQLDDLRAFVDRMPTLSPATVWEKVEDRGVYKSAPVLTSRAVQQPEVLVRAAATDKHPAQTDVVMIQKSVGTWTRFKYSGGVPVERKEQLLKRIARLRAAVNVAHVEANRVEAVEPVVGEKVLGFLFDD